MYLEKVSILFKNSIIASFISGHIDVNLQLLYLEVYV